jgi:hypothetical protein
VKGKTNLHRNVILPPSLVHKESHCKGEERRKERKTYVHMEKKRREEKIMDWRYYKKEKRKQDEDLGG